MKTDILSCIDVIENYNSILDATTGVKQEFTKEETENLLRLYKENGKRAFGFDDEFLVKMMLVMDTAVGDSLDSSTMKDMMDKADLDGLGALFTLCKNHGRRPEPALKVKAAVLSGGMNEKLSLAMARAALDVLVGQNDITPYREDINALAAFLKQAGEDAFADASRFLLRVMERAR